MAQLSRLLTDTKAVNDGMWQRVNEALYDDLDIMTRGYTDEFVDAQAARNSRARSDNSIPEGTALPNAIQREVNASLLRDFLVLDVRNLEGKDGQAVAIEAFHAMLSDPAAARLVRACWDAAGKVSARTVKASTDAAGN